MYKGSEALSRKLRCAIGIFYGRWYSPVPNKVQLTVLVGKPITVEKVQDPDSKQVQNAFSAAAFKMFNDVLADDAVI